MNAGARNLRRQVTETTRRWDRLYDHLHRSVARLAILLAVVVGVIWPLFVWFVVRPENPDLAGQLLLLVLAGWLWTGLVWSWSRYWAGDGR